MLSKLTIHLTDAKSKSENGPLESVKRQVSYSEILEITNNFQKSLGKGGFGTVYHGKIGDNEVAVKMLSESSVQGYQEFLTEVPNYMVYLFQIILIYLIYVKVYNSISIHLN